MTDPAGRVRILVATGIVLLVAQAAVLLYLVAQSHGVFSEPSASSTDFLMIYATGRFADMGDPAAAYDLARQQALQQSLFGAPLDGYFPFYYPPVYILICAVLALPPYYAAFAIWLVASGGALLFVLNRIAGTWPLTLALFSFPAVAINAGLGQNAFLTAALIGLGTWLLDERPWLAGIAFGALCYKPHFALMAPIALIAGRRWRALLALATTGAILVALSVAIFGVETWRAFIANMPTARWIYLEGPIGFWSQISVFAAIRLIGGGSVAAAAGQAIAVVAAVAAMVWIWARAQTAATRAGALVAATLLSVPMGLSYDLMPAMIAAAWILGAESAPTVEEVAIIGAIWMVALFGRGIAQWLGIPLFPLVPVGLMAIAARRLAAERPESQGLIRSTISP